MLESAILVIKLEDIQNLDEAMAIAREAGFDIKEVIHIKKVDTRCYISSGILEKIRNIVKNNGVKKICIYDELKPRHVTCLMKELRIDVVDKVMMILNIFQQHAGSKEALLQIEIARLKHQLPLVRDWIKRVKSGELPGFLGPGRYAVDVYYKHITKRISRLVKELDKLRERRTREREARKKEGFIHVAIVGYTNAGKTTLFNTLTNLVKPTGTEMFTTLSPKSYLIKLCNYNVIVVDTIGFIKDIPLDIIEAFKAVLEEISTSDAIMLVVDGSKRVDQLELELRTIFNILKDIGSIAKPMVIAINKVDLAGEDSLKEKLNIVKSFANEYHVFLIDIVPISALKRLNIGNLKEALCRAVEVIQKNSA